LASAYFYRQRRPNARILILDTNDDFGGHAKRNEFHVDGKLLIGYGGTQSIDSPQHKWHRVARDLLKDLDIDVKRFNADFDQHFYSRWPLQHAVFFKKEVFGSDRLVRRPFGKWGEYDENPTDESSLRHYLDQMPLSDRARAQLFEMYWSDRDDRDVTAITVNRWPHGYAYTPTPLYDDPAHQAEIAKQARQRLGRIAIANSDSGWDAYTHVAIDQAHRAVLELTV
jgi:protoporphyrinogen oxidase